MALELVLPSNHLVLSFPLLLLPSIFPSIRVFSNELALHIRWPRYWSFSFSISPFSEYSELISFRVDWLDLLAVQRTLKSLLQHHSSKASVLQHSAFFIVQLAHPYMTTGKTIAFSSGEDREIMSFLKVALCSQEERIQVWELKILHSWHPQQVCALAAWQMASFNTSYALLLFRLWGGLIHLPINYKFPTPLSSIPVFQKQIELENTGKDSISRHTSSA